MDDWRIYSDVADTYERIHAPRFAVIARDLVEAAGVGPDDRVLDLGTGTGVAAEAARERGATVVGIDLSEAMLRVAAQARPALAVAAGAAIDLPFRDGAFDVVLASFVVPNLRNHTTALADVFRVLFPGGRFAMTAWSNERDELSRSWDEVANAMIPDRMLQQMRDTETPDYDNFGSRDFTEQVLGRAGFRTIRSETHRYRFAYGLDEYLEGQEVFKSARFVREMLGDAGFETFRQRLRTVFADRFADPLQDTVHAVIATGVKPGP